MYARYTEYLRDIMQNEQTAPLLNKALSTYPMYVSTSKHEYIPNFIPTREELNKKLLNAYKYREIGFETVGRFLDELEIAMCEIMPYYNQLMFSADQDYNIVYNVDYKREIERKLNKESENNVSGSDSVEANGTNTTNSEVNASQSDSQTLNSKGIKSDTPQNLLDIGTKNINSINYASEAEWNENIGSNESESTSSNSGTSTTNHTTAGTHSADSNGIENEDEKTTIYTSGNYGQVSAQSLIEHYREIIVNIEQKIINDRRIKELFMQVY